MTDAAKSELLPPAHVKLTPTAMKFWPGIVRARARDEWSECDLVVAAHLASCQADMSTEDAALRREGKLIKNAKGTKVMSPRLAIMEQLARREMALMRTLQLGGRVASDPRDQAGKRAIERQARALRGEIEEEPDELLAS